MNSHRLNRIKDLFDKSVSLNQNERESFLNNECGDDIDIKNEVISLINSLNITEDFLEQPLTISEQEKVNFVDPYIGKQIGNYIIDGEAGVGGMGIVYSGKRNDKEFEQKVAIKILKHGITSEYLSKRFQIERQTLANLQHPNIARLLDGGRTIDGLPYLVMEYIDGIPITQYCSENKLSLEQKLNVFRKVCSAVQYAHQNLVIHRDLKPGNILITKNANVKLLDFGIAKLIGEDLADYTDGLTKTGVWHLTPEYASPEQIKGEKITTASDVYSLGVLLYQILTGIQPYRITNNSPVVINKIITEEKIQKPSEKVKDKSAAHTESKLFLNDKISNQLKGDLDNIVSKAMSKDPLRRYASVEQFSEDIRRHLTGLPVIAQKDTTGYRLKKFIQRHKVGFVLSIGFIVFLIASMIAIIWQANVAASERDNAKNEAEKVETVNSFLLEMLSSVDPTEVGRDVKVYDVLKKASAYVGQKFSSHPEIEALLRKTIGKTLVNLSEYDEAEVHLLKSLELNNKVFGNKSYQSAESLHELALYYHWVGDLSSSDSLYKESIRIFRMNPDSPPRAIASTLNDFATLLQDQSHFKESLTYLYEAYNIFTKNFGLNDRDVASTANNIAMSLEAVNDLDGALEYYNKSLEFYLKNYGTERPEVSTIYNNLSYIYISKNDFATAESYFKKSLDLKIKTLGEKHSLVGLAYTNLGAIQYTLKKFDQAEKNLLTAGKLFRATLNSNHIWRALADFWYSKILIEKREYNRAEDLLKSALSVYKNNYDSEHPNIVSAYAELGVVKFHQKKYSEAEKLLVEGYEKIKVIKGEKNFNTIRFLEYLVRFYTETNNLSKTAYYQELLAESRK
ncbi:serine/threonine-protein kinase [Ignavibacterium sp.]|uniref:serine/threonine-protein kinase n=1 Tax=Ignavibacterium sp. TaxID=2651167 RepID=UPI00307F99D2